MKYIMLRIKDAADLERDLPVIFPESMVHALVFESIRGMRARIDNRIFRPYANATAISAGTINFDDVSVSGGSETLGLEHRPEDARIITMHDYFHGLVGI